MTNLPQTTCRWSFAGRRLGFRPRPLQRFASLIEPIRSAAARFRSLDDTALAAEMAGLRSQVDSHGDVQRAALLVPVFALVVEAARRVLAIDLYDVQLLGGMALAGGAIAELQTGEGKTFVALLPASLHALAGRGVHVMTVNDYLARRDFDLLAPVYRRLGLTVGLIDAGVDPAAKRAAYASDITYGPGYEFGFDYLRDQTALMARRPSQLGESFRRRLDGRRDEAPAGMQRGQAVAIVDEADSVMIDEATTPLVLAAGGDLPAANADVVYAAKQTAAELIAGEHFVIDSVAQTLHLTSLGWQQLAAPRGGVPQRGLDRPWPRYVEQALRAERLFHREVHYVVRNGKIELVDQSTGRIFADRSWRDGLYQAVQAKEGVTITAETQSIARITRQRFFRLYHRCCGMTGTAQPARNELRKIYGLNVVAVPPHKPCRRKTLPTRVFIDAATKERAIVAEIERRHTAGQPVLVGTASIETSLRLSRQLAQRPLPHQLLNGTQTAEEAEIVARAGRPAAITIATNMAGRGTDIRLAAGVAELGGLHVIACQPQLSARIDRQLVGRAARQGDPGSCQIFAAADDPLFARHAAPLAHRIGRLADSGGEVLLDLSRTIAAVQRRVEREHARQRQSMFAHDDWLEGVLAELHGTADRQR